MFRGGTSSLYVSFILSAMYVCATSWVETCYDNRWHTVRLLPYGLYYVGSCGVRSFYDNCWFSVRTTHTGSHNLVAVWNTIGERFYDNSRSFVLRVSNRFCSSHVSSGEMRCIMKEKPIKQEWKLRHWDDHFTDSDCASLVLFCVLLVFLFLTFWTFPVWKI